MKISFAPMEGLTGYVFRNVHHRFYGGISEYYTPFLAVTQTRKWKHRESGDVSPAHNTGIPIVPQLLTNNAEGFLWAADSLYALGYRTLNLNLGCPSATVVTKHKGAGFLADPDRLDRFFDAVFQGLTRDLPDVRVSVKTRTGISSPEEMFRLLPVFNRYPLAKLIVHPRVREAFYGGSVDLDTFRMVYESSTNPVVYNGDILTVEDARRISAAFPNLDEVMIGRGLIRHPDLAERITRRSSSCPEAERSPASGIPAGELQRFRAFHDALLADLVKEMRDPRHCLDKMKEYWSYWALDLPSLARPIRKLRKIRDLDTYHLAADAIFAEAKKLSLRE